MKPITQPPNNKFPVWYKKWPQKLSAPMIPLSPSSDKNLENWPYPSIENGLSLSTPMIQLVALRVSSSCQNCLWKENMRLKICALSLAEIKKRIQNCWHNWNNCRSQQIKSRLPWYEQVKKHRWKIGWPPSVDSNFAWNPRCSQPDPFLFPNYNHQNKLL